MVGKVAPAHLDTEAAALKAKRFVTGYAARRIVDDELGRAHRQEALKADSAPFDHLQPVGSRRERPDVHEDLLRGRWRRKDVAAAGVIELDDVPVDLRSVDHRT